MKEISGRPLIAWTLCLVGALLFRYVPLALLVIPLAIWLCERPVHRWIAIAFALVGMGRAPIPVTNIVLAPTDIAEVVTVVAAPRPSKGGSRCLVSSGSIIYVLNVDADTTLVYGDEVFVRGVVAPFPSLSAPYWRLSGASGMLTSTQQPIVRQSGPFFAQAGEWIHRSFVKFANGSLRPEAAKIVTAICFNHDSDLDSNDKEDLIRSGIFHIVSTSGMHVLIVGLILTRVIRYLPLGKWAQSSLLMLLLLLYSAASGMRIPMVRSVLMFGILSSDCFVLRRKDFLSALCASTVLTLIWSPRSLFDISFQLSFAMTLGLALFSTGTHNTEAKAIRWVMRESKRTLQAGLVASFCGAPLFLLHFKRMSTYGMLSSLAIAPVVAPIVIGSILLWLLGLVAPGLAVPMMHFLIEPLALYINFIARIFSRLPGAQISITQVPVGILLVMELLILSLARIRPKTMRDYKPAS